MWILHERVRALIYLVIMTLQEKRNWFELKVIGQEFDAHNKLIGELIVMDADKLSHSYILGKALPVRGCGGAIVR